MFDNKRGKDCFKESEAGILDAIAWIADYNGETLTSKLKHHKFSKTQIMSMAYDVRENSAKLSKQYMLLLDLSQTYNNLFAAEIKQDRLVSIAQRFEQLKEAVELTKATFGKFKELLSNDHSEDDQEQSSNDSEKENYMKSLPMKFSIGQGMVVNRKIALSYKQCSNLLCNDVEEFYKLVLACLMMCQSLIQEEKKIMGDSKELEFIYEECFENAWDAIQVTIDMINPEQLTEKEMKMAEECCTNLPSFLIKYFHKMTNLEFTRHVMAMKFLKHQKEKAKTRSKCMTLFLDNPEMEQKVKMTIRALDNLNLETRQSASSGKRQFTTKAIIALKEQFGYEGAMETFITFLKQNYTGDLDFPKPSALSIEKGKEMLLSSKSDFASRQKWKKLKGCLDIMKGNIRAFMEENRQIEVLNISPVSSFC